MAAGGEEAVVAVVAVAAEVAAAQLVDAVAADGALGAGRHLPDFAAAKA